MEKIKMYSKQRKSMTSIDNSAKRRKAQPRVQKRPQIINYKCSSPRARPLADRRVGACQTPTREKKRSSSREVKAGGVAVIMGEASNWENASAKKNQAKDKRPKKRIGSRLEGKLLPSGRPEQFVQPRKRQDR